jgi:F-type H+-transporting ATPase subunit a
MLRWTSHISRLTASLLGSALLLLPVAALAGGGEAHGAPTGNERAMVVPSAFETILIKTTGHHWPAPLNDELVNGLFVAVVLAILAVVLTRRMTLVPGKTQTVIEWVVEALHNFVCGIIGPKDGPRYVPFIGTLFIYILVMNLMGLVPGFKSATANPHVTIGLAITAFVYVQYQGIRANGLLGYLKHFAGEPVWMAPLNVPIHIIGELARPISLAIRLFGNKFGEDTVVAILIFIAPTLIRVGPLQIGAPMHLPMLFLGLLVSFIQAMVFSMLVAIYIAGLVVHDDHGHAHDEDARKHGDEGVHHSKGEGVMVTQPPAAAA